MSMVGEDSLVVGLISQEAARHEQRVLQEMAEMGATVLAIGQELGPDQHQVVIPADLPGLVARRYCTCRFCNCWHTIAPSSMAAIPIIHSS